MTYLFHPEAQAEHLETVAYYGTQQAGKLSRQVSALHTSLSSNLSWPGSAKPRTATQLRVNQIFVTPD